MPATLDKPKAADRWRAVGCYKGDPYSKTFLVCVGESKLLCLIALKEYVDQISYQALEKIETIWMEQFHPATAFNEARWVPWKEADLKRHRLRAATVAANAANPRLKRKGATMNAETNHNGDTIHAATASEAEPQAGDDDDPAPAKPTKRGRTWTPEQIAKRQATMRRNKQARAEVTTESPGVTKVTKAEKLLSIPGFAEMMTDYVRLLERDKADVEARLDAALAAQAAAARE